MTKKLLRPRRASHWHASGGQPDAYRWVARALFGLAALVSSVQAQDNYTYTGTTGTAAAPSTSTTFTGAFTDTSTNTPLTTPAATDNTLTFGGSASYAATDDIASLTLTGGLSFTNTAGTVTINSSNASTIVGTGSTLGFAVSTGLVTFNPAINAGTATLAFSGTSANTGIYTINSVISGSGGLTDSVQTTSGGSAGSIALYGTNTYTGATTINAGASLILDNISGLGTSTVTVQSGGELDLNSSANGTVANAITLNGTGVGGGGAIRGVGPTTFSGAITLGSNSLIYNNNTGYDADISGTVNLSTFTLTETQAGNASITGIISGIGGLTQSGTDTLTLTGTNTYSGTTTISSGTLQISAGGTTATLGTGNVVDNAALTFDRSNAYSVANAISGTGTVTQAGGGVVTLTGTNTYSGTTTISAGTLQISANGTTATIGTGNIVDNAALSFDRNNNYAVANAISGTGTVTQIGPGILTLSGANTYTGTTMATAGTLSVTGSTAAGSAASATNSGSVLGGTGTIGGTVTIGNGATLLAGNSATVTPGTLTTGTLTLQTGSTFNAVLASNGSFSTLSASGTTSLSNATFNLTLTSGASFTNGSTLELITSAVSGTFMNSSVTAGGYVFTANYMTNPGFFDVTVTTVPEPAVWTYGFVMIGLMGVSRRRKIKGWLSPARG